MRHHRATEWEQRLEDVFDEIDAELEETYGDRYRRYAGRPGAGETSDPSADGLFNIGAQFSPGYSSGRGPGYVVEIRTATREDVTDEFREKLFDEVRERLEKKLPQSFPGKTLSVERYGSRLHISGDLSLGEA
ncbi:hypothetical protein [Kiritimatiella glycovorans]|uniref:Uncharacterized protein n=1 Tax=Kiritimatiella glycovorans TaxID=1307763 RepID=A0A0G3EJ24_9BACT|nr:hypothetical protein [Kiritimatiella glycovorans]AKJ65432.1 hypothetical protein L21SP4_02205 [Kiritimatiella glycovorans]